ncbi:uncharacterized protein METZ01_LOCUS246357, partial [marine metagenome]
MSMSNFKTGVCPIFYGRVKPDVIP